MGKLFAIVRREFQKKAWDSVLQLVLGGGAIYLVTIIAGPGYGCGAGNAQLMDNAFTCTRGEMALMYKLLMVGGIVLASLCWGRAASLYEKRRRLS